MIPLEDLSRHWKYPVAPCQFATYQISAVYKVMQLPLGSLHVAKTGAL